jgi:hypothetical protein
MRPRQKLTGHRLTLTIVIINFSIGIPFGTSHAHAQNPMAESLFDDGNKLMADGKLAEACRAFEASNRVEPRAGTLIRLGECREKNQQLASAWSAYKDARTLATDPRKQKFATTKAAELEPRLSRLTIAVSDQDQTQGLVLTCNRTSFDPILWNLALPVDGGDYTVIGYAPGYETWERTIHVPLEGAKLSVDVPTLRKANRATVPEAPPLPTPSKTPATSPTSPAVTPPVSTALDENINVAAPLSSSVVVVPTLDHSHTSPQTSSKIAPLVVGAGAFALLGGGLGFEIWAESRYAAAKSEMTSQLRRDSLYDAANTKRYVAEAIAVSGLATGGLAVWLYLRDDKREHGATINASVHVVPTATGLALSGQF